MSDFSPSSRSALHRFGNVGVRLSVELGRTEMMLRDVLLLGEGSTVALNRLTDEALDLTANGRVIARGEVVTQNGRFALKILSLVGDDGVLETAGDSSAGVSGPLGPVSDPAMSGGADVAP
ncbi:flagellar motor switch protein FliN/FliY [Erythrobacter litoralis]|uniref:Flagellar motor switch protein FliN n=1 Tax=Erythrobacter litoralis TaxID=39960 RepID=A0A074M4J1_9SPHN|nr:FliM/FliN family flagellar motor switch protein [Erythrobacter litoralis]AOL22282.1 flagellar motor switch protein FliN/FliY [Erythrobacter litoralis]KEO89571.1 hypothetical protein EH32_03455 [Erythrobacter litoralis]